MTTVGFIGLGVMGYPMARNLLANGFDVIGYNRSQAKADRLASDGGRAATSVADAVSGADIVITMLPDSPDVQSVLSGPDGVFASARPGTLVIDMSTIRPDVTRDIAAEAAGRQLRFIDAPVSGGEQGAIDGALSIMVGGPAEDVAEAQPALAAMGATIVHVGPAGAGQTVKAANQLIVAGTIELVAEALTFLDAQGVDLPPAIRVLAGGLAGSTVLDRKGPAMLARNFAPGFRVDLHHKDLGIFSEASRQAGTAAPLGALVTSLMASLRAQGMGDLDHSALLLQVEELSGRAGQKPGPDLTHR
jgi:2-hydroxy-3-oxopropionate reductase